MNAFPLILAAAAVVYACRLSGFLVTPGDAPHWWQAYLRFVPISVFSALIVPSMMRDPELLGIKVVAFAVAALVIWKTRRFEVSILSGLGALWLLTLAAGA